tara:strand:+ start:2000 stop:4609 length:2610 start_codon:yes stop_codon:yes gene_type:complete
MTTPARSQYLRIKEEHKDEILLFRMGDFYETFDSDAHTLARELEIALTSREMGKGHRVPLAGIPYHALNSYLSKLIRKGYKVAICEQTSDPATSKGLVQREVVRVVTPGTVIEESILDGKSNNYLASVILNEDIAGLAYVDITTSEFSTTELLTVDIAAELARLNPSELLIPEGQVTSLDLLDMPVTEVDAKSFKLENSKELLLSHFSVSSLEAYGCHNKFMAIRASGAILEYLYVNQKSSLANLTSMYTYSTSGHMALDQQTRKNLELFEGGRVGDAGTSLISVLDHTKTSMGGRLIKQWIGAPLIDLTSVKLRQDAVSWFHDSSLRRDRMQGILASISDLERLVNKIRSNTASPRDLLALGRSLKLAPKIRNLLLEEEINYRVEWIAKEIEDIREVVDLIDNAIEDDSPPNFSDGGVIRSGFSTELDEIKLSTQGARDYIAGLENHERDRTGIKSLKIGYNKVFGYYIEVSKSNIDRVPEEYIRRQTLVGGERYITPEMKEYESQVLSAQERIVSMESELFGRICRQICESAVLILNTAKFIANVDVFCSLGEVASNNGYVRPDMREDGILDIRNGRHPVVEHFAESGSFVPNDTIMSVQEASMVVLTGPNMSGKSTFLRQVGLITLMAQIGSYVPADSAIVGVVDRIFTRVGLQDDLSVGQSTFMVEMLETASILNHATNRSLVILDEIGRGTSTYDGLAIARAVAEYIHNHPKLGCKTLFATHYHELTDLPDTLSRAQNYNVLVSEQHGDVIFLHRILPGGSDRSYGVHVARLAGLPAAVIKRAWELLDELEGGTRMERHTNSELDSNIPRQLPLIDSIAEVFEDILDLDISSITPLDALNKLYEIQKTAKKANNDLGNSICPND